MQGRHLDGHVKDVSVSCVIFDLAFVSGRLREDTMIVLEVLTPGLLGVQLKDSDLRKVDIDAARHSLQCHGVGCEGCRVLVVHIIVRLDV